jgi:hypothetical protein
LKETKFQTKDEMMRLQRWIELMHCYANEVVPQGWWIQSLIDQKGIET